MRINAPLLLLCLNFIPFMACSHNPTIPVSDKSSAKSSSSYIDNCKTAKGLAKLTCVSSSSQSSSSSAILKTDTLAIYSDQLNPADAALAQGTALDIWKDAGGDATLAEKADAGKLGSGYLITGTGTWVGLGIRTEPATTYQDCSRYSKMVVSIKSSIGFKIGLKDSAGTEAWITSAKLADTYHLTLDDTWNTLTIPLSAFISTKTLNTKAIGQLFMFVSDGTMGYNVGSTWNIDEIMMIP